MRQALLGPSPKLTDPGERRRARWLAGLFLLMLGAFGVLDSYYFLTRPGYAPPFFGYLFLGANYALLRSGRFRIAALSTIGMFPAVTFALVATGRSASPQTTLSFLVLGVLLSSVLLQVRVVLAFTGIALFGIGALHVFGPPLHETETLVGPAVLIAIAGGIASVGALLRQRIEDDRREQLRAVNAELERRVRARTAELERANAELEAFAYSASHDLRTPLRAVDAYAAMLAVDEGPRLSEDARQSIARIRASARRMTELVDGLLDLAKVGRSALRFAAIDVAELAREIVEELRAAEPRPPVEFVCPQRCEAMGDRTLVRIALFNLLENAWKFTRKEAAPRVELGCDASDGGLPRYFVKDNGIGFDPGLSADLFQPFRRLHRADEFAGTGIGAAIVARVMDRHGGRVWAESRPGAGATFYFTLPAAPASEAAAPAPDGAREPSGNAT